MKNAGGWGGACDPRGMSLVISDAAVTAHESALRALANGDHRAAGRGLARALETDRYWQAWTLDRQDVYGSTLDDPARAAARERLRVQIAELLAVRDEQALWEFRRESAGLRVLQAHLAGDPVEPIGPAEALAGGIPAGLRQAFRRARAADPNDEAAAYYSSLGPALVRLTFDDPDGCLAALAACACQECTPYVFPGVTVSLCGPDCPNLAARNPGFRGDFCHALLVDAARATARRACLGAGMRALERQTYDVMARHWRSALALTNLTEARGLRDDLRQRVLDFADRLQQGEHRGQAIAALEMFRALLFDDPRLVDMLAGVHLERGIAMANADDLEAGLEDARAAYRLAPRRDRVWQNYLAILGAHTLQTFEARAAVAARRLAQELRAAAEEVLDEAPGAGDAIHAGQVARRVLLDTTPADADLASVVADIRAASAGVTGSEREATADAGVAGESAPIEPRPGDGTEPGRTAEAPRSSGVATTSVAPGPPPGPPVAAAPAPAIAGPGVPPTPLSDAPPEAPARYGSAATAGPAALTSPADSGMTAWDPELRYTELERVFSRDPEAPTSRRRLIEACAAYAAQLLATGAFEAARQVARRGLELSPEHRGLREMAVAADLELAVRGPAANAGPGFRRPGGSTLSALPGSAAPIVGVSLRPPGAPIVGPPPGSGTPPAVVPHPRRERKSTAFAVPWWRWLVAAVLATWWRIRGLFGSVTSPRPPPRPALLQPRPPAEVVTMFDRGAGWVRITTGLYEREIATPNGQAQVRAAVGDTHCAIDLPVPEGAPNSLLLQAAADALHVPFTRLLRRGAAWVVAARVPNGTLTPALIARIAGGLARLAAGARVTAPDRVAPTGEALRLLEEAAARSGLVRGTGPDFLLLARSGVAWSVSRIGDEFVFEAQEATAGGSPAVVLGRVAELNGRMTSLRAGLGRSGIAVHSATEVAERAMREFAVEVANAR